VSRHGGKLRAAAFLVGFLALLAIGRLPAVRMALPDGLGRVEGQGAAGAVVFILPHMASCMLFVPGLILGPGAGAICGPKGIPTDAVLRLPRKANCTNIPWCTYTDPGSRASATTRFRQPPHTRGWPVRLGISGLTAGRASHVFRHRLKKETEMPTAFTAFARCPRADHRPGVGETAS
jgi:hypothetical protein